MKTMWVLMLSRAKALVIKRFLVAVYLTLAIEVLTRNSSKICPVCGCLFISKLAYLKRMIGCEKVNTLEQPR